MLEPDEIASRERRQQVGPGRRGHLEAGHQGRKQRGVADADPVVLQAGRIQGVAEHGERLGGSLRGRRADQLDPRLQQLPRLAALGAHPR